MTGGAEKVKPQAVFSVDKVDKVEFALVFPLDCILSSTA